MTPMWKQIVNIIQPIFVLLAGILMMALLANQWDQLRAHSWRLHGGWLLLSALFLLASWAVEIEIWRRLLQRVGGRLAYWPAVRIWFLSAIVRYVPGNIWQPLSLTLRCQQRGIPPEATLTSVALYQAIILLAVAPIAALYFGVTGNFGFLTELLGGLGPWLTVAGLLPVFVFLLRPRWLLGCINWALAKAGRPLLETHLSSGRLLFMLTIAMVDWLLWGATFLAVTLAILDAPATVTSAWMPHLIAAYPIAYAIGFLSFITPSGFGVREGALMVLLAPVMGAGAVTLAALAMRFWTTVGEFAAALISGLMEAPRRNLPRRATPVAE